MKKMILGITQRVSLSSYAEKRDSLALDWYPFLNALGLPWLTVPNQAETAMKAIGYFGVGGLILTGGDDLGIFPERDETERRLLRWAENSSRPVIGVCRGFQVMWNYLGGSLAAVDPGTHRAQRHHLMFGNGIKRMVNSYHNYGPEVDDSLMKTMAVCEADGSLEAAARDSFLGLMWHPEREAAPTAEDIDLFVRHFREFQ